MGIERLRVLIKNVLARVAVPWILGVATQLFGETSYAQQLPTILVIAANNFARLMNVIAVVGVASIFVEEILRLSIMPHLRGAYEKRLRNLSTQIRNTQDLLVQAIAQVGRSIAEGLKPKEPDSVSDETPQIKLMGSDPDVQQVKDLLFENRLPEAKKLAGDLAKANPEKYNPSLLSALLIGTEAQDLPKILELLPVYGEPRHYIILAFKCWELKDTDSAIKLSEEGLAAATDETVEKTVLALKNSLAYYYAAGNVVAKAEAAYELAQEALQRRIELGDTLRIARSRSTLGYVRIVFGRTRDEVFQGLSDCAQAHQEGSRKDLFLKHLQQAAKKLSELGSPIGDIVMGDKGDTYSISGGQVGAVGRHARARNFQQIWNDSGIDAKALAKELSELRSAMRQQATDPEHDAALGHVASAETAADSGDGVKVLEHLKMAGRWALDVASNIGARVAAAAIKAAMGL